MDKVQAGVEDGGLAGTVRAFAAGFARLRRELEVPEYFPPESAEFLAVRETLADAARRAGWGRRPLVAVPSVVERPIVAPRPVAPAKPSGRVRIYPAGGADALNAAELDRVRRGPGGTADDLNAAELARIRGDA